MRIAHLIIVHKNPEQLLRLVRKLEHPNFDLFIHIDQKVSLEHFSFLETEVNIKFIKNRVACNWGGNSVMMSIINSVQEILTGNVIYDYINVISGQDYPLMSTDAMLTFFKANHGKNFISFDDTSQSEWWQLARDRYEKYHFTDLKFRGKYLLQSIVNKLLPKRRFHFFATLYGGSNSTWWTITSECATYLVHVLKENHKLRKFMAYTWCSDEFIVATIIMNSPFRESAVNNNLRYIDWSEQKASPKILTIKDLEKLGTSNMMFARKFDVDVDEIVLDMLDLKMKGSKLDSNSKP